MDGVAKNLIFQFRSAVLEAASDELEGAPGRLTRAYIRVAFALAEDPSGLRDSITLGVRLMAEPGPAELVHANAALWHRELSDDGLAPAITRLIVAATDGSNGAPLWGSILTCADRSALEADLIALTRSDASHVGLRIILREECKL